MLDLNPSEEDDFFSRFLPYFDAEKDAGKQHDPANYSLERMKPLAELAGHPEERLKILHVAGTKGKGTTCTYLAALLKAAGKQAGLFTSPHVRTVRERFQENLQLLSYQRLRNAADSFLPKIRAAGLQPSLFEIFTVLALQIFAEDGMEYAVLETGIGGRLDATNYVSRPEAVVLTPVSFDHMALLGNTIEQIAGEKAGICKETVPVILAPQPYPEAENVLKKAAAAHHANVIHSVNFQVEAEKILPPETPPFLMENFASALAVMDTLGLPVCAEKFQAPEFRARFEIIRKCPLVMLDGAHNEDSMRRLTEALLLKYPRISWNAVLGIVKGKDVKGILRQLKRLPGLQLILTNPRTEKGSALPDLKRLALEMGFSVRAVIPELTSPAELPPADAYLFTGSFFTAVIGETLFRETT